jgi:hypothetical protein
MHSTEKAKGEKELGLTSCVLDHQIMPPIYRGYTAGLWRQSQVALLRNCCTTEGV